MSQSMALVPYKSNPDALIHYTKERLPSLRDIAASGVDINRYFQLTVKAIRQNPSLAMCTVGSIYQCMETAISLGLEPNSPLRECYLVPFKNECTLIIGYGGLIVFTQRAKVAEKIEAYPVFEGDEFGVQLGTNPYIEHSPRFMDTSPNKLTHVYACATLKGGGKQFVVLSRADVDRRRERSRAGNVGPWVTDYIPMAIKTAIRDLMKFLPMSVQMLQVIEADNREFGEGLPSLEPIITPSNPLDDAWKRFYTMLELNGIDTSDDTTAGVELTKILKNLPAPQRKASFDQWSVEQVDAAIKALADHYEAMSNTKAAPPAPLGLDMESGAEPSPSFANH